MKILSHLQEIFDVVMSVCFLAFWFLWQQRGTLIQKLKVQAQKSKNDVEIAPIKAQATELEKQIEEADADRLKKEALLTARLNGGDKPSGSADGSKPVP